jgi:predicted RNase H-like HicB family nuclease
MAGDLRIQPGEEKARMSELSFTVVLEQDEDGAYVAHCPELPGCWSCGDTEEEALDNIEEAIIGCLRTRLKWAIEEAVEGRIPQQLPTRTRNLAVSYG